MSFGSGIGLGGNDISDDPVDGGEWGYDWGNAWGYEHEWDMEVDQTGDIKMTFGFEELKKDIAFRSAAILDGRRGEPLTPSNRADIRALVKDLLNNDPRLGRIVSLSVTESDNDPNKLLISTTVNTEEGQTDLVFEV